MYPSETLTHTKGLNPNRLSHNNLLFTFGVALLQYEHIEGFQPERYISTLFHCRDIPFWSETLDI